MLGSLGEHGGRFLQLSSLWVTDIVFISSQGPPGGGGPPGTPIMPSPAGKGLRGWGPSEAGDY